MAIYDAGTASLAASGTVTGVGTTWMAPLTLIRVGATIVFKTEPVKIYTISEIISDTQINVYNPNSETVPAGTGYAILAHDGITVQGLAQDVAETLRYYQSQESYVAQAVEAFGNFDATDFNQKVSLAQSSAEASQLSADSASASAASSESSASQATQSAADSQQSAVSASNWADMARDSAESVSGALVGSFQTGVEINSPTQQILDISNGTATSYIWAGDLPKTVPSNSSPQSTGGVSSTAWIKVGSSGFKPIGAVGDGVADDTQYLQAQLNTGVLEIEEGKTYRITSTLTHDGYCYIFGNGKIVNDFKGTLGDPAFTFKITRGSKSRIENLTLDVSLVPYTIIRNEGWAVQGGVRQSKEGYIPGPQDLDIWESVTAAQRSHNERIGCGILFDTPDGTLTDGVVVSGIKGYQVNIVFQGATNCTVKDLDCGLGQFTYSGVYFHNGVGRAYNQAILGRVLGRGVGNSVLNCKVRYSSLSGISFTGNDKHSVIGCTSQDNAESGFKTTQYDGNEGVSEDRGVKCTRGTYIDNYAFRNYYDGFDLQSVYAGVAFEKSFGGFVFSGNISESNRLTGFHSNSNNNDFSSNTCNSCGDTGIAVLGDGNIVSSNKVIECALQPSNPQAFQIMVQGDGCSSFGNNISKATPYSTYDYLHTGYNGNEPSPGNVGIDYGNYCSGGAYRQFISQSIKGSQDRFRTGGFSGGFRSVSVSGEVYKDDMHISVYGTADITLTLPPADQSVGMVLKLRNTNSFAVMSSAANIGQVVGGAPTNVILPATVGSWCELVCDGSVWLKIAER